jgi:hypothetical protein
MAAFTGIPVVGVQGRDLSIPGEQTCGNNFRLNAQGITPVLSQPYWAPGENRSASM